MDTDEKETLLHPEIDVMNMMKEMQESISEIEKSNKFIVKRLSSQQEQIDGGNLHIEGLTETLKQRLEMMKQREKDQDEEMRQLVKTVAQIGDTVSDVCTKIDTLKDAVTQGVSGRDQHRKYRHHHESAPPLRGPVSREESSGSNKPMTSGSESAEVTIANNQSSSAGPTKQNFTEASGEVTMATKQPLKADSEDMFIVTDKSSNMALGEVSIAMDRILASDSGEHDLVSDQNSVDVPKEADNISVKVLQGSHRCNELEGSAKASTRSTGRISDNNTNMLNPQENSSNLNLVNEPNIIIPLKSPALYSANIARVSFPVTLAGEDGCADEGMISDEMWAALVEAEASNAKASTLPYGDGIDTVILIDISDSMKGSGLEQIKEAVSRILDGVEMVARDDSLEENIGVVTFGHITQVRHYLTKDYEVVRHCVGGLQAGGASPLCGGLLMALALFKHQGDATTVVYNHVISPRIVLLSDGKATDHDVVTGDHDSDTPAQPQVRESILKIVHNLAMKRVPVYCVPVGDSDQGLLTDIVEMTSGKMVALEEVSQIGRHLRNLVCALRTKPDLPSETLDSTAMQTAVRKTQSNPTGKDMEDMVAILSNPVFQQTVDIDCGFNNLTETDPQMLSIGKRVHRGPDWKWKNQDQDGVGTVIGHGKHSWIKVEWDCTNKGEYRYGAEQAYDVLPVDDPRLLKYGEMIATGCLVCRGIDWEYDEQDGGFGKIGVVYNIERDGHVWVRWPSGDRHSYRYGLQDKFDLVVCDPFEVQQEPPEVGATGGQEVQRSRTRSLSSVSESSSIGDVIMRLDTDDEEVVEASVSIYDMAPPAQPQSTDSEGEDERDVMEKSLVEAMNKRNEASQSLRPHMKQEYCADHDDENVSAVGVQKSVESDEQLNAATSSVHARGDSTHTDHSECGTMCIQDVCEVSDVQTVDLDPTDIPKDTTVTMETPPSVSDVQRIGLDHTVIPKDTTVTMETPSCLDPTGSPRATEALEEIRVTMGTPPSDLDSTGSPRPTEATEEITIGTPPSGLASRNSSRLTEAPEEVLVTMETPPLILDSTGSPRPTEAFQIQDTSLTMESPPSVLGKRSGVQTVRVDPTESSIVTTGSMENTPSILHPTGSPNCSTVNTETSPLGLDATDSLSLMDTPKIKNPSVSKETPPSVMSASMSPSMSNASESMVTHRNIFSATMCCSTPNESRSTDSHHNDLTTPKTGETQQQMMADASPILHQQVIGQTEQLQYPTASRHSSFSDSFSDSASMMSLSTVTPATDVVWQWEDMDCVWHSYTTSQCLTIEKARRRGGKATALVKLDNGESYRVVLYKHVQIHTVNRRQNRIRCLGDVANLGDVEPRD